VIFLQFSFEIVKDSTEMKIKVDTITMEVKAEAWKKERSQ